MCRTLRPVHYRGRNIMSLYQTQKLLYQLNKDVQMQTSFLADHEAHTERLQTHSRRT